jgi:hypothetical protein
VQLITDTTHGLIVNVRATTDAIDNRHLKSALDRCARMLGHHPRQVVADGDYTNHASLEAEANCGVDFYGSWQESRKPRQHDAQGRRAAFWPTPSPIRPSTTASLARRRGLLRGTSLPASPAFVACREIAGTMRPFPVPSAMNPWAWQSRFAATARGGQPAAINLVGHGELIPS